MRLLLKDSHGRPSFLFSAAFITLGIVLLRYAVAGMTLNLGPGKSVAFGAFDSTSALALLGPTFLSYVATKHPKLGGGKPPEPEKTP